MNLTMFIWQAWGPVQSQKKKQQSFHSPKANKKLKQLTKQTTSWIKTSVNDKRQQGRNIPYMKTVSSSYPVRCHLPSQIPINMD